MDLRLNGRKVTPMGQATEQAFVVSSGIQAGSVNKRAAGTLTITFPTPFKGNPVVILTPFWALQSGAVGSIETVVDINSNNFTLSSANAAPSYYVNWVAYGPVT